MAALMKIRSIFVYTHDSIGLGEDGPTHQSIEHAVEPAPDPEPRRMASLRHRRVGGGVERQRSSDSTARRACCSRGRASRSTPRRAEQIDGDPPRRLCPARQRRRARAVIIATGSEVALAVGAQKTLAESADRRCASCRCRARSVFDRQDAAYRDSVLPRGMPRRRRRGRSQRLSGANTSARSTIRALPSSASTASASRRRRACCSSISDSPSSTSSRR